MDEDSGRLILDAASQLFDDLAPVAGSDPAASMHADWAKVVELGLPLGLVSEEAGGFAIGGTVAASVLRAAVARGIDLPLGETMIGNALLARVGLAPADGILGLATLVEAETADGRLRGRARRAAWGAEVDELLIECTTPDGPALARLARGDWSVAAAGANLAGSPRPTLVIDAAVERVPLPGGAGALRRSGAALRTIQIAGAAQAVIALTVDYVGVRQQFGRALSKFQAIQQEMARMAGQAAVIDGAAGIAAEFLDGEPGPSLALAAAKARASEAAGVLASIAHQAHGAIGFSMEYRLGELTRMLWSWREEYGGQAHWQQVVADAVLAAPADDLWPIVTAA